MVRHMPAEHSNPTVCTPKHVFPCSDVIVDLKDVNDEEVPEDVTSRMTGLF